MKISLPIKSKAHESRIKEIAEIIIKSAKDKIAFLILFGSFARGTWVRYKYAEMGVVYEYASDYDFLIITKTGKQANGNTAFDLERKIKKAIENSTPIREIHRSHIIIESVNRVNEELEKSQYFFSDIKKEGILLYDSGEFELSNPKEFNKEQREKIAKLNYEHWLASANGFLIDCESAFKRNDYKRASFYLHQATESLYSCALLTLGGYKPKSHNLEELNQLCIFYSPDFLTIFPKAIKEQKECFELLQRSYIEARYSEYFCITKAQLEYLIAKVEGLKGLVKSVCC
ncbi:MAG: HEPN domain-containing protein [Rickettsiales bacterium]|nr:HEPN domain-containing protein [Rickettsiales bacterium]